MPGYYVHFATCGGNALKNRSFVLGVEAPDILKKHVKVCGGIEGARAKYEALRTADMPDYQELEVRIQQEEKYGSTDGLHYGMSSSPDIGIFWNSLNEQQKNNPFYRGYVWHLLTDAIVYGRMNIDAKYKKAIKSNQEIQDIDELERRELNKLHDDWDKTNARVRDNYPEVYLTEEVEELGVVKFIDDGELVYIDWPLLKDTIDYLRTFDPLNGDIDAIIETVMNSI